MHLLTSTTITYVIFSCVAKLKIVNCVNVVIKQGRMSGSILRDYYNNSYYAFQSIPFAKPPIGELRFAAPQEPLPWIGSRNGSMESPSCVQPNNTAYTGQEDCLYLNVYTNSLNSTDLQPVIVYVHGGGFNRLSGSLRNVNPGYLITENIVIVTINYRLSTLGFLTLNGSGLISANNGFKDQIMALKWVQNNILYFGGDPNAVTLSGESAGALSTHYHLFSPLAEGLFHRVICRSSTGFMALQNLEPNNAVVLARQMGIATENFTEMVQQLRAAPLQNIYEAQLSIRWFDLYLNRAMYNGLFIEQEGNESFITESVISLAKKGNFQKVPIMLSITNSEGLLFNTTNIANMDEMPNMTLHIPKLFGENSSVVHAKAHDYYFKSNFKYPLVDFWGDVWFRHSTYRALQTMSSVQLTYVAYFTLDTKLNVFKRTHDTINRYPGACHTDDDTYIYSNFRSPIVEPNSIEQIWMRRIIRMQANFVKNANPTPISDELLYNIRWLPYETDKRNILIIKNDGFNTSYFANSNFEFWDDIYQNYSNNYY